MRAPVLQYVPVDIWILYFSFPQRERRRTLFSDGSRVRSLRVTYVCYIYILRKPV